MFYEYRDFWFETLNFYVTKGSACDIITMI